MTGRVRALLIDLNGTLHIGEAAIEGAGRAVERLLASGIPMRFVTNTTTQSRSSLFRQLGRAGITVPPSSLVTSVDAARLYVLKHGLRPLLLVADDLLEDFHGISTDNPNCVLVGLAPEQFKYGTMNKAFRLLMMPHTLLIAIHKGKYFMADDGQLALGPGPFVSALEYATGKKAHVVGKPSKDFFECVCEELGVSPMQAAMIGDDVLQDVKGAQDAGMVGALVRTGKYLPEDEQRDDVTPQFVFDSVEHAVEFFLDQAQRTSS